MRRRSRRLFLQVTFAGLTAGLAGCGMPGGEEEEDGGDEGGETGEGGEGVKMTTGPRPDLRQTRSPVIVD